MDIFVRGLPNQASQKQVTAFFKAPFQRCGINDDYHVDKMRNKHMATITILDSNKAQAFLSQYGVPSNAPRYVRPQISLRWNGRDVLCSPSRIPVSQFSVQSLAYAASQRAHNSSAVTKLGSQNAKITRFAVAGLKCGVWDYSGNQAAFFQHWTDTRQGTISFGSKGAVILLGGSGSAQSRVDLEYHNCHNIVVSGNYQDPAISFTLRFPPKFYEVCGDDVLAAALMALALGNGGGNSSKIVNKTRLSSINDEHTRVSGTCFVYRVILSQYTMLSTVRGLLDRSAKSTSRMTVSTPLLLPPENLQQSFTRLNHDLTDDSRHGRLPFNLRYQIDRLARNGVLLPSKVRQLLPKISHIHQTHGLDAALSAVGRFFRQVPFAGPDTDSFELTPVALESMLDDLAAAYEQYKHNPQNAYELVKRHKHIELIHKVVITPAGTYLEAPEPEPTNRVLRRYASHSDHFVRVVFQDEDGGSVRYDPRASNKLVFHERFKGVLDGNVLIAGRAFSFLGFSHSSLRSQTCWFMAPMYRDGSLQLPERILRDLGNFENIKVPAKCAARIGQNFTDTNATIDLAEENVSTLTAITRNGYDFSDGVGTISQDLLRRVWRVYGTRRTLKPTALQIRFKGYKGMVSLDSRLRGEKLMLRDNMMKFDAPDAWNLEICGAGFKPLPMILNRQLIKILEDLGVGAPVLLDLQQQAVDKLRYVTATNAVNAASFLEEMDNAKSTRMPSLIRLLNQIGLDYRQDQFLYQVIEMAVVTKLRDIKYRGRIPVPSGHTLYGIMDETGYLQEGEIYVVTEGSPEGGRKVLVMNGIVISRSPALHPGDAQIANAVDVPADSPLQRLFNVVVFSQHGYRDLPSQLSGGDLDGDQFHIIFDRNLIPPSTFAAAEYPRVSAVELDRPVTRKDMSDFLVTFMETDQLGMLCNTHLQLADQSTEGAFDPRCIKLSQMASTAVDSSKSGLFVDMKEVPKHDRCRPDFMAPSPRVIVSSEGHLDLEEEDNVEDPAFEDLDVEKRAIRYYESKKVLGQLYRAIDEQHFLAKMHHDRSAITAGPSVDVLDSLLQYMMGVATQFCILFSHHLGLARDIRVDYEESLIEILHIYAPSANMPVSEHEAFAGDILGRKGGVQNKSLRELGKTMRERFQAIVDYNIMRIIKGDDQMQGVGDLDLLYDDPLDREVEALPRALACLQVAVEEQGLEDRQLGELQSFKYIAAGVCLREYERYRITTLGSYVLPRA